MIGDDPRCEYRTAFGAYETRCPKPGTVTIDTYQVLRVCNEHRADAEALVGVKKEPIAPIARRRR